MSVFLAATQPARTIVIEHEGGGTPWWVPLLVALAAAVASYYATWRFKRADVDRQNALRAADLIDEAERLTSEPARYEAEPDASEVVRRLVQQARIRAQPLNDKELDDRFMAALLYLFELQTWRDPPLGGALHWLYQAIANVRLALVPHMSAPKLLPRPRKPPRRWFPTSTELNALASDPAGRDAEVRFNALRDWGIAHPESM
jgi:hypothetical protein